MTYATLAGTAFPVDPSTISWTFGIKVNVQQTIGGRVVQVFGTTLGNMTVTGTFGENGEQQQKDFYNLMRHLATQQKQSRGSQPFRFTYSLKGWDFHVLLLAMTDGTSAQSITYDNDIVTPDYSLTLFIVQDNTQSVVRNIRDQYIARLTSGVGFKQTTFDGPLDALANPIGTFENMMDTAEAGG